MGDIEGRHLLEVSLLRALLYWDIVSMGLLLETQNCGLRMRRECRERFPRHRELVIPTCITARA